MKLPIFLWRIWLIKFQNRYWNLCVSDVLLKCDAQHQVKWVKWCGGSSEVSCGASMRHFLGSDQKVIRSWKLFQNMNGENHVIYIWPWYSAMSQWLNTLQVLRYFTCKYLVARNGTKKIWPTKWMENGH